MRTFFKSTIAIMCIFFAQNIFAGDKSAVWLETEHDFGTIAENNGKVSCMMRLVNATDSAIVIIEVRPACGCTAVDYPHRPINPGDTATVILVYNPYGRPGEFDKPVTVRLNTSPKRTVLKVKGTVIASEETISQQYPVSVGSLKLSNSIAPFGEIIKGSQKNAYLSAYNTGQDSVRVYHEKLPENITVTTIPDVVPPGGRCSIVVHLDTKKTTEAWGPTEYTFRLLSEPLHLNASAYAGIARITAIANLHDDFSKLTEKEIAQAPKIALSSQKIDFGSMGDKSVTRTVTISNDGKNTLEIYRLLSSLPESTKISIDKQSIKQGKSTDIAITATIPEGESYLNATLTIYSNDPKSPVTLLRLVGTK